MDKSPKKNRLCAHNRDWGKKNVLLVAARFNGAKHGECELWIGFVVCPDTAVCFGLCILIVLTKGQEIYSL